MNLLLLDLLILNFMAGVGGDGPSGVGALCGIGRLRALAFARVRRQISHIEESCKQHKVAKVHGKRQFDVDRWNVAATWVALVVLYRLYVIVGPKVDGTADNHLCQLQRCDDHWNETWRFVAHGTQCIIRIHHRMHAIVHHNEPSGRRRVFGVGKPWIDQYGDVMIPMQKDQRLLA